MEEYLLACKAGSSSKMGQTRTN